MSRRKPKPEHIYLIHFARPYRHARHYIGYTRNISQRMNDHESGRGARLMAVITEAGMTWELARTWPAAS